MLSLALPYRTWAHRLPAALKFGLLAVAMIALMRIGSLAGQGAAVLGVPRVVAAEEGRSISALLTDRLEASEDRLAVLERIVTDKSYSLATQIEALRDEPARLDNKGK